MMLMLILMKSLICADDSDADEKYHCADDKAYDADDANSDEKCHCADDYDADEKCHCAIAFHQGRQLLASAFNIKC